MMETKERIRSVAEKLFFENGIANVRLQQIADDAGISVGNLAYHYKNKEAIVQAVYEHLFEEFEQILASYLQLPDLRDFDQQFELLYQFFTRNTFYLNNVWEIERSYPHIKESWHRFNQKITLQIRKRLEYNQKREILQPEPYKGTYDQLAQAIWITLNYWIPQQMLQGKRLSFAGYRKALWNHVLPYLTDKGIKEYEQVILALQ